MYMMKKMHLTYVDCAKGIKEGRLDKKSCCQYHTMRKGLFTVSERKLKRLLYVYIQIFEETGYTLHSRTQSCVESSESILNIAYIMIDFRARRTSSIFINDLESF